MVLLPSSERWAQILESLLPAEGWMGLLCHTKRKKFRNGLYRHIRACGNYKKVVEQLIQQLCQVHEKIKKDSHIDSSVDEQVVAIAAHLCEKYYIIKDKLVREVLEKLVMSQRGDFKSWFDFLSPFGDWDQLRQSTLYPFKQQTRGGMLANWTTEEHLKAMNYYLSFSKTVHINVLEKAKVAKVVQDKVVIELQSKVSRVPIVDGPLTIRSFGKLTPLALACMTANPMAVLLLLRHGADPRRTYTTNGCYCPQHSWYHPINILLNQLNQRFDDCDPDDLLHQRIVVSKDMPVDRFMLWRVQCLLLCLVYLMRSMDHVLLSFNPQQVFAPGLNNNNLCHGPTSKEPKPFKIHSRYATCLANHTFTGPRSLEHICRIRIRQCLHRGNHLPGAIYELPLPLSLKRYLNLSFD